MLYIELGGRLGNWMFQYAAAKSLHVPFKAYWKPSIWKMPIHEYVDLFHDLEIVNEIGPMERYREPKFGYSQIPDFDFSKDILFTGDFQSDKYFDKPLIRAAFAPTAKRIAELRVKYGEWISRPHVTGLSVRRTDYLSMPEIHPFLGLEYYRRCLALLPACRDFIVCSDDIGWCRATFPKAFPDRNFYFVEGESVMNQLYVHTLCQNNIVSNSSFSWWGAWLNPNPQKRVFMPSMWLGFRLKRQGMDWSDLYFEGVEVVRNGYTLAQVAKGWCNILIQNFVREAERCGVRARKFINLFWRHKECRGI